MRLSKIKWAATICLIVGFTLFSAGVPQGFWLQILGGVGWLTAAVIMRDAPLILTNAAMITGGLVGRVLTYL